VTQLPIFAQFDDLRVVDQFTRELVTAGQAMSVAETHATVDLIRRIAADFTILIVEHDMEVVMGLARTITVLHYGEVLAEGTPVEIQANPRVQEVYLKT